MAFRLTVSKGSDLTTVRIAGRLGDDAVTPLQDACGGARRPIVVDLSEVTGASEAGVMLLHRLTRDGIHLLGASRYITLLLAAEKPSPARPRARRHQAPAESRKSRRRAG